MFYFFIHFWLVPFETNHANVAHFVGPQFYHLLKGIDSISSPGMWIHNLSRSSYLFTSLFLVISFYFEIGNATASSYPKLIFRSQKV